MQRSVRGVKQRFYFDREPQEHVIANIVLEKQNVWLNGQSSDDQLYV
jgi:transcription termination factor Rho